MSRGRGASRGAFGRGGFGGGGGRGNRIGGQDVPWDYDPELKINKEPSELFPKLQPPVARAPTEKERTQVARYRALRDRIHEGPLYTILGDNVRVGKTGTPAAAHFDPFEGMPTYTQKYKRQRRRIPRLDTRPYVMKFFPEELWDILDPKQKSADGVSGTIGKPKKKRLQIATGDKASRLDEAADGIERAIEEEEELGRDPDEGEGGEEEEPQDDDFEEDEDDMADDYNAETYFSNGEDDYGDEGGDDFGGDDYS